MRRIGVFVELKALSLRSQYPFFPMPPGSGGEATVQREHGRWACMLGFCSERNGLGSIGTDSSGRWAKVNICVESEN